MQGNREAWMNACCQTREKTKTYQNIDMLIFFVSYFDNKEVNNKTSRLLWYI